MNETRDGRQISPQWQFRPVNIYHKVVANLETGDFMPTTSDVIVSYVTIKSTQIGAIDATVTLDGYSYTLAVPAAANTVYYLYMKNNDNSMNQSTTATPFLQSQAVYARSFTYSFLSNAAQTVDATVRYQSL